MPEFSTSDLDQLKKRNVSPEQMEEYLNNFRNGFASLKLAKNASVGREIKQFSADELKAYANRYLSENDLDIVKFVPASGAASRMFKTLFAVADGAELTAPEQNSSDEFFKNLSHLAFYHELKNHFGEDLNELATTTEGQQQIATYILSADGLGYGNSPKGMVLFHQYPDGPRTAFAEHLSEGAMYARMNDMVHIHFTLPEEGKEEIEQHLERQAAYFSKKTGAQFLLETSVQNYSTDTPAVTTDNKLYRTSEGELFFRPAGHGALLENLNNLEADVIFIKNIDNVVPEGQRSLTVEYKQALAGYLLFLQNAVFGFLRKLDDGTADQAEIENFIHRHFGIAIPASAKKDLHAFLNRPMRVCGMVKNSGEPGGGPFVVEDEDGAKSLQIVEAVQIDTSDPHQKQLLQAASHFNPVDIVCATRNYQGKKFDLFKFRESTTGIITTKSVQGEVIKALELPGLWNGAMHHWLTAFVEVPADTFNPVKTVFDLLRPAHRS